jgi:hypothetical protein
MQTFDIDFAQALKQKKINDTWGISPASPREKSERKVNLRSKFISAALFLSLVIFLILPFHGYRAYREGVTKKVELIQKAYAAADNMTSAGRDIADFDLASAHQSFLIALDEFHDIQHTLNNIPFFWRFLLGFSRNSHELLSEGRKLVDAFEKFAGAGRFISLGTNIWNGTENDIFKKIKTSVGLMERASESLAQGAIELQNVNVLVFPNDVQRRVTQMRNILPFLRFGIEKSVSALQTIQALLADGDLRRYLVIFQNNGELRGTGGFMGSFALVDIHDGKIKNIEIPGGGFYDLRAGIPFAITPPTPLTLLSARFEAQDANWWPDFPTSARKLAWFYEQATNRTIDGVIAINANVLPSFLNIFGPITLQNYGKTLTQETVISELQYAVDLEYDLIENRPKKIIADLAPLLLKKILNASAAERQQLATTIIDALSMKDIQLFFIDPVAQTTVHSLGWDGALLPTEMGEDSLFIVHTNLGGRKTDRVIQDAVTYNVNISENGEIKITLRLTRSHKGVKEDYFTGVGSVDYLRIYTPRGSQFISSSGFDKIPENLFETPDENAYQDQNTIVKNFSTQNGTEIYEENDKTVFANWILLDVGEKKTVEIQYSLPVKLTWSDEQPRSNRQAALYRLSIQKQSGSIPHDFIFNFTYPKTWQYSAEDSRLITEENSLENKLSQKKIINSDTNIEILFEKP